MPNTLGLDDESDPVGVVQHLERVFDISVSDDDEVNRISKVGEFYDFLLKIIPPNDADAKCASAMTFYRIRSALQQLGYGAGLAPASDISVLEHGRTKANLNDLEKESGLVMPQVASSRTGRLGSLCGFFATLIGVFCLQPGLAFALLGILAGGIVAGLVNHFDPGRLPAGCKTLGGLTRVVAAENYGRLVKMGARHRSEDIWENLTTALSHHGLPKSEITRETFFLQSQFDKQASA